MKKILLISLVSIIQLGLIGSVGYLWYSNSKINKKIKDFDANFYVYAAKIDSIDNSNDYSYDIRKLQKELQDLRLEVTGLSYNEHLKEYNRTMRKY